MSSNYKVDGKPLDQACANYYGTASQLGVGNFSDGRLTAFTTYYFKDPNNTAAEDTHYVTPISTSSTWCYWGSSFTTAAGTNNIYQSAGTNNLFVSRGYAPIPLEVSNHYITIQRTGVTGVGKTYSASLSSVTLRHNSTDNTFILKVGSTDILKIAANVLLIDLQAAGGGGGGGTRYVSGSTTVHTSGDGGHGGAFERLLLFASSTSTTTYTLTIGAGGSGGSGMFASTSSPSSYNGSNGGNTTISDGTYTRTIYGGYGGYSSQYNGYRSTSRSNTGTLPSNTKAILTRSTLAGGNGRKYTWSTSSAGSSSSVSSSFVVNSTTICSTPNDGKSNGGSTQAETSVWTYGGGGGASFMGYGGSAYTTPGTGSLGAGGAGGNSYNTSSASSYSSYFKGAKGGDGCVKIYTDSDITWLV